jgi:hypothetical protein
VVFDKAMLGHAELFEPACNLFHRDRQRATVARPSFSTLALQSLYRHFRDGTSAIRPFLLY